MNNVLLCSGSERWEEKLRLVAKGFKQFGQYNCSFSKVNEKLLRSKKEYDVVICLGWYINEVGRKFWQNLRDKNIPIIFLSDGCFFYHYKHKGTQPERRIMEYPWATFMNAPQSAAISEKIIRTDLPDDRLKLFSPEIDLKKWRKIKPKKHILITHQVGCDYDGNSKKLFYKDALERCLATGRNVIFRLHPQSGYKSEKHVEMIERLKETPNCTVSKSSDRLMREDLKNAHCLVTHGGKAAARAIISGIPAITCDVSIAEMVAERNIENIENPKTPKRSEWVNWLSYCHWSFNEMSKGLPWKHLTNMGQLNLGDKHV